MAISAFFSKHPHLYEDKAAFQCLGPLAEEWGLEIGIDFAE